MNSIPHFQWIQFAQFGELNSMNLVNSTRLTLRIQTGDSAEDSNDSHSNSNEVKCTHRSVQPRLSNWNKLEKSCMLTVYEETPEDTRSWPMLRLDSERLRVRGYRVRCQ